MKPSKYNFFFPYEADKNKVIAYNSFSNALALMEKEKHEVFERFCSDGEAIGDEEFVQQLKSGHFIIDADCNELEHLRFRMLSSRYSTRLLSLTIAPTSDCNFRCPYCYEKDIIKPVYMSEQVQDKIIEFVKSQAKTISNLGVTWYGGEPLMAIDVVEKLSREFIKICEENDITYYGNIVTNGYLLTKENSRLLKELKVESMQITIDGNKDIHNVRRPHMDGYDTFETIINNLVENKDELPVVSIRVNVDKDNIEQAREVKEILGEKKLLDKMQPYLGKITAYGQDFDNTKCFDMCGFAEVDFDYFSKNLDDLGYMHKYPRVVSNACTADAINSFVIASDGELYRCWVDIGDTKKSVGNILSSSQGNEALYLDYIMFDATTDSECSKCNLLPACMGGCPLRRMNNQDNCTSYKHLLNEYLNIISLKLKLQKDSSESAVV